MQNVDQTKYMCVVKNSFPFRFLHTFANYKYFCGVDESVQYSITGLWTALIKMVNYPPPPFPPLPGRFQIQLNFNKWKSFSNLIANIWKLQFDYLIIIIIIWFAICYDKCDGPIETDSFQIKFNLKSYNPFAIAYDSNTSDQFTNEQSNR